MNKENGFGGSLFVGLSENSLKTILIKGKSPWPLPNDGTYEGPKMLKIILGCDSNIL